jgi:hypothetical protein
VPGLVAGVFAALLGWFLHDFVPQRAWLQGSVLVVKRGQRERRCDLATAEILRLGRTMPPLTRDCTDAVPVLRAQQQNSGPVVRRVLPGDGLCILPAAQLLLLAEAIPVWCTAAKGDRANAKKPADLGFHRDQRACALRRDGGIRTRDPLTPSQVRYQAALRPGTAGPPGQRRASLP